ncbi:TPA: hypothetical protein DCR49_03785 [Candidatus Delongbacteria bacterium]|nr:hypothetical protein [Candidatus Delongbacteria bacterium]
MITPSKFSRLRKITKYFKIAEELKSLRDSYLSSGSADLENIKAFRWYLEAETDAEYIKELDEIIDEPDSRKMFEKIHFLYHRIKDDFGYPEPESRFIISSGDSCEKNMPKTGLVIILENLRSAFNAGSIIRSCECFGAKELILSGITPGTENSKTLKTAKGTENNVKITRTKDITKSVNELKNGGYIIYGAETGTGSTDLRNLRMPEKSAVVFGNEEIGMTEKTLKLCDKIVSIEMRGMKNSLNVSNAVSIFLYEYSRNNR